ncbi:MAG TPA: PDZ domain-containing protein [Acidimicrobiales bacterium]|nr:PDZ domain-containing protein [Acidimicrobiales bacterium]
MLRRLRYYFEMRAAGRAGSPPPPSQRTWVHPSELPGSFDRAVMPPPRVAGSRKFKTLVASTASALLLAGGVLLAEPTGTQLAGASTGPHVATSISALPAVDRTAAGSMLALVIYEGQHLGTATAMVLPPGDLAVTTTPVPKGVSVMGRILGHPSMSLKVVGTDHLLGVTVLQLPITVPVTPTAALAPAVTTGGAPTALTALAAVRGALTAAEFDYAAAYLSPAASAATVGHSVISVTHGRSLAGVIAGTLVLDARGQAVAAEVPALGATTFVPATFLQLLAERIVLGNATHHGWLQLVGAATSSGRAKVVAVTEGGASWRKVLPGDTILAINSVPVRTMADVGSILFTSSPGQPLDLTVLRAGHLHVAEVILAASP